MMRLLIYSLIRFIIAAFVIYFVLTLAKGIFRIFAGSSGRVSNSPPSAVPPKPKEDYKDVQEAKFIELPNHDKENKSEQNS
jgi:hypothetical protein